MGKHIVIVGAGAVGGYVGGQLARAGEDVSLVDPWPQHVNAMRLHGLHLSGTQGEHTVPVTALHFTDVQRFTRKPVDIAIISTKSYDTAWAAMLIRQYLAPGGYIVSLQNSINEEEIARVVGWGRTVGCIASTISVNLVGPGRIQRYREPGGAARTVFYVGEAHGAVTPRVQELVSILGAVDTAKATDNLWGQRWTKLATNAITHGLLGATGLDNRAVFLERGRLHRLGVKLAAEAVAVGRAQGYRLGPILGIEPDAWVAASNGDRTAQERVQSGLAVYMSTLTEPSRSSVGRDVERGRRSEIDYTNGMVAAKGLETGVPAPTHAAVTELVRRIDRGDLAPDPANIEAIPI
ncbi:MAG TPA: 2-dehydropantoate 2-reductase [Burkholderiales bacterium]|nr:2-dehydropantoate 2-reductase [Burkholderiales bacterium]